MSYYFRQLSYSKGVVGGRGIISYHAAALIGKQWNEKISSIKVIPQRL